MIEAAALLPDGTEQDLTGLTEFFIELTNGGTTLMIKAGFSIDLPVLRRCPCGVTFSPKKSNQVYHDTKCGSKARMREWRRKKAEENKQSLLL